MTSPRRRWTPETIQSTLEPIVAELGRFPKPKELAERGLTGLSAAIGRNGGVAEWKTRFATTTEAAPAPEAPAVEPVDEASSNGTHEVTHEDIATRAYYLALEHPDADPMEHWLAAERELVSA
jgi:hypothetical protein